MKKSFFAVVVGVVICAAGLIGYSVYENYRVGLENNLLKLNLVALTQNPSEGEETVSWQYSKIIGTERIQTGTGYWSTSAGIYYYPIYDYMECCVQSVANNRCNGAGLDSRCGTGEIIG